MSRMRREVIGGTEVLWSSDNIYADMGIPDAERFRIKANLSERKLMDCLTRLGYDVEISVRPAREATGRLTVARG